jgi:tetratricopeptide (TPR) repeat protein
MAPWWKAAETASPHPTPRATPPADWLRLNAVGLFAGPPPAWSAPLALPQVPGYEVLDVLGRGGMGVVYRARHLGLNRTVALKMLLAGAQGDPDSCQRFRAEAAATARLQHPNIVQIHEGGVADGLPYLALEYVDGRSLEEALQDGPLAPEEAARLLETVARAVQAAHERGIIHRDLKPANVLRTKDGTPKIVDFGLAKRLESVSGLTHNGAFLGTPAYMAPEQLSRRGEALGPACDIYALGVILYEMLAGRPPFEAGSPGDLLFQVTLREPISPRYWRPALPRDLETICLKCLRKEPGERYASAAALADDLRRFLDHRPIQARPVGLLGRAGHWCRRNPGPAGLAATVMLCAAAAVLSLAIAYFQVRAEQQRTEQARQEAVANEAKVLAQAEQARQALDREARRRRELREAHDALTSQLIESLLVRQPQLGPSVKQFLQLVEKQYEHFAADSGADPEARAWSAMSFYRLGTIRRRLGEQAGAETALRRACALLEGLVAEQPEAADHRQNWAKARHALGLVLLDHGKRREAESECRQALDLLSRLVADQPGNPTYFEEWGAVNQSLCQLLRTTGRPAEAMAQYQQALALPPARDPALAARPGFRHRFGQDHTELGRLLKEQNKSAEAECEFRQAIALLALLVDEFPKTINYQRSLANARDHLGQLLSRRGKTAEAEEQLRQALELRKHITAALPAVPEHRHEQASAHLSLSAELRARGHLEEAAAEARQAIALREKLVAEYPGVVRYLVGLAGSHRALGQAYAQSGGHEAALPPYDEAVRLLTRACEREERDTTAHRSLLYTLKNRAESLAALNRLADAAKDWQKAAALSAEKDRPEQLFRAADTWLRAGNHATAFTVANEVAQCKEITPATLYRLAGLCAQAAALVRSDTALHERYAARAVALLAEAYRAGYFKDAAPQKQLSTDGKLAPLRARKDFQALLTQIAPGSKTP